MVLFATPDFGATGFVILVLLGVGAVILLLAAIGFMVGMTKYGETGSKAGCVLSLVSLLFPMICYFAPGLVFRLQYGHFPLGAYPSGKIEKGMTPGEVQAILGLPQRREKLRGEESWFYDLDSFGVYWFGVDFGPDGRVRNTYGN
jgi:hypothetical protein